MFGHSPSASSGEGAPWQCLWSQQVAACRAAEQVSWCCKREISPETGKEMHHHSRAATCGPGWAVSCLQAWRGWQHRETQWEDWWLPPPALLLPPFLPSSTHVGLLPFPQHSLHLPSLPLNGAMAWHWQRKLLWELCRTWTMCLIAQLVAPLPKMRAVMPLKWGRSRVSRGHRAACTWWGGGSTVPRCWVSAGMDIA